MSEERQRDSGRGIGPRQIVLGLLVLLVLWFVVTNFQKVQVDYIVGSAETPLWLVIVLSIGIGMLIDRGLVVRGRRLARNGKSKK